MTATEVNRALRDGMLSAYRQAPGPADPAACADCGMDDLPLVAGWRRCRYCYELGQLRGWVDLDLITRPAAPRRPWRPSPTRGVRG